MFADLATDLAAAAGQLSSDQLVAVAEAAPAFQWPVYRSIPLLHAVSREAVHRSLAGALPLPVAQRVLSASAKGAAAMRPRLGHDLEEASAEWMRTGEHRARSRSPAGTAVLDDGAAAPTAPPEMRPSHRAYLLSDAPRCCACRRAADHARAPPLLPLQPPACATPPSPRPPCCTRMRPPAPSST